MSVADSRFFLRSLLDAAIAAAAPASVLPRYLPAQPKGRTIVVGAGKAAAAMARAVEDHWRGDLSGLVITRHGYGVACERIEVIEASHPVPDAAGMDAARRIRAAVQGLSADDLVLFLASGGGSALMALPAPGIELADKQAVTRALLKCGATIGEINCVRKHLSAIKGGRLAAAAFPARVVTLAISDVVGDDPSVIASGATVPDPTTYEDAAGILRKYDIVPPPAAARRLREATDETPKPGDRRLARSEYRLIATPQQSLDAAAKAARDAGVTPAILSDALEGEARAVAADQAALAMSKTGTASPLVLLSGGELTVTVRGQGRGGPNTEFILALALALKGHPQFHALAADTDGIDGTEDNAGAICDPATLARAANAKLDLASFLANNDSYGAFAALGDLVVTGPTRTNINDFRAILIQPPQS
ncbi:MAG TPA: glycerate kinase [Stellaceae bacterium]|nr:glycerate kinase [Stellaceae bacterium]